MAVVFCLACAPALLGRDVISQVSALHVLGTGANPYFPGSDVGLLYFLMPLVVLSSFFFFLAPGVLFVLALGRAASLVELVVCAFGASMGLCVLAVAAAPLL